MKARIEIADRLVDNPFAPGTKETIYDLVLTTDRESIMPLCEMLQGTVTSGTTAMIAGLVGYLVPQLKKLMQVEVIQMPVGKFYITLKVEGESLPPIDLTKITIVKRDAGPQGPSGPTG